MLIFLYSSQSRWHLLFSRCNVYWYSWDSFQYIHIFMLWMAEPSVQKRHQKNFISTSDSPLFLLRWILILFSEINFHVNISASFMLTAFIIQIRLYIFSNWFVCGDWMWMECRTVFLSQTQRPSTTWHRHDFYEVARYCCICGVAFTESALAT